MQVAKFLTPLSTDLSNWKTAKSFKDIDKLSGNAVIKDVEFNTGKTEVRTNLILIMHPSARAYNLDSRNYKGKTGKDAQIEMMKDLLDQ